MTTTMSADKDPWRLAMAFFLLGIGVTCPWNGENANQRAAVRQNTAPVYPPSMRSSSSLIFLHALLFVCYIFDSLYQCEALL
jgi:hypothetical protein